MLNMADSSHEAQLPDGLNMNNFSTVKIMSASSFEAETMS